MTLLDEHAGIFGAFSFPKVLIPIGFAVICLLVRNYLLIFGIILVRLHSTLLTLRGLERFRCEICIRIGILEAGVDLIGLESPCRLLIDVHWSCICSLCCIFIKLLLLLSLDILLNCIVLFVVVIEFRPLNLEEIGHLGLPVLILDKRPP